VGDPSHGDLALGAARTTGGAIIAVAEDEIVKHTALLSESTGVTPDYSGGAALGALVEAIRRGDITAGERVVLVVTGARPVPTDGAFRVTTIEPDAHAVLTALGLHS
jgi:threonine synthase